MLDEPLALPLALGEVGFDAVELLGDRCGDEAESRRLRERDRRRWRPAVESTTGDLDELVRPCEAHLPVRLAGGVVPSGDASNEAPPRCDDLDGVLLDEAVQLDLVQSG